MRGSPYIIRMLSGLTRPKDPGWRRLSPASSRRSGSKVTQFKPGDAVFGGCRGAFAEYACAAHTSIVAKPANVTFEQAAAVASRRVTALQGLRDQGKIQRGHNVLVNGASGGVGTFAVQIAKSFGADVTGVCSTRNVELVHSLGADRVIDYTREDFTQDPTGTTSSLTATRAVRCSRAPASLRLPAATSSSARRAATDRSAAPGRGAHAGTVR